MRTTVLLMLSVPVLSIAGDVPAAADQIALAVLAAPEESRAGAGVWGYDDNGKPVNLREATNDFVCFGDNPALEQIAARCIPKHLEYWQLRRYELRAQGTESKDAWKALWKEVESGKLAKPPAAWTVHILEGSSFDASTGRVSDYVLRWIVTMPNATAESVGLSAKRATETPWLMRAGTPNAHIMVPGRVTEQP